MFFYDQIQEIVKHGVRGGEGEVRCRDYIKADPDGLKFESFGLNEMQPGATIPEHCHADSGEFYYIVAGHGTGLHNGREFDIKPGDGWYCRRGETHGILNTQKPGQVLSFISVFFT